MNYTNEELELVEAIENNNMKSIEFDNEKIKAMALKTQEYMSQKKQISINMKQADLDFIKQRAKDVGISYQNIIQALVHNYASGKLKLSI